LSDHDLLAIHRGDMSGDALETVCGHLSECGKCQFRLDVIEKRNPDEMDDIRLLKRADLDLEIAECSGLEQIGKRIGNRVFGNQRVEFEPTRGGLSKLVSRPRLGKYELREMLGRGGMGVVYRAHHTRLNRDFAIKVIRPEFAGDPKLVSRFLREALALGGVDHPNIVSATDADEAEDQHFLVMELIEGFDLETVLKRHGPLAVADACEVIRQTSMGLQAILDNGRVHRDLKPSNLMLSKHGVVKILDLGLARLQYDQVDGGLTGSKHVMGTADYMAPEQWTASHRADVRSDIYGLGCTFFRLLVGVVPFKGQAGEHPAKQELAHAEGVRPSARDARPEIPSELDSIVKKMIAADPKARLQIPAAVADAVAAFCPGADLRRLVALVEERSEADRFGEAATSTAPQAVGTPDMPTGKIATKRSFAGWPRKVTLLRAALLMLGIAAAVGSAALLRRDPHAENDLPKDLADQLVPRPGVWFDSLRLEPQKLLWNDIRHDHFFGFNTGKREIRLDVPTDGLVSFGRVEHAGYQLQMNINQTRWVGGTGIFFGYQDSTIGGKPCKRCQILDLRPRLRMVPKDGFFLDRVAVVIEDSDQGPFVATYQELCSVELPTPKDQRSHVLFVEVNDEQLTEVRWDGQPFPKLIGTSFEETGCLTPTSYAGHYGAHVRKSTAVYGNVQVQLFERQPK
jgi:serine/threonine protein kinase